MLSHELDRLMAGEADELNALTTQRDKLEAEQIKLMQAHYADALPLTVLKKEQARIGAELDHLNARLERHHGEYADAKAVLTRCLDLLDNLGASTPAATTSPGDCVTRRSSPRSTSRTKETSAPSTPNPSTCCSTHRSKPAP